MESATPENKTRLTTQQIVEAYFKNHEIDYVAEDAVFTNLATGEETRGREAVGNLLHYMYHVAFEAKAEVKNIIATENKAFVEADFKGKHIGEFAGIAPTNKKVNVPLGVSYELENGLITKARIYLLANVLMQQLQG
jgi:steroid delta-isomerase-like uncharacterized protein